MMATVKFSLNDDFVQFVAIELSEWLLLNSAVFHGENKIIFNEMMLRFALY